MRTVLLLLAILLSGCSQPEKVTVTTPPATTTPLPPLTENGVALTPFLSGLHDPVLVLEVPDGSGRFAVVEQAGTVRLATNGTVSETSYLDVHDHIVAGGEQGLLGFAFSPSFKQDGVAYASFTDVDGKNALARYHRLSSDELNVTGEEILLRVDHPYANHNGGDIVFGPDGFLYDGLGDGGSGGDPHKNGQNPDALLASMLRLDVSGATGYKVPPSNPYANGGGKAEVWAKGLRNPWRFSFDKETGDLWIGDVGQDAYEEIDYQPRASKGGENYGWNVFEGNHPYDPLATPFKPAIAPVYEFGHDGGNCAVTGGYVYRGASIPALRGAYVFSDYCSGKVWALRSTGSAWNATLLLETHINVSSFGEDSKGELYVVDLGGSVYKLAGATSV